MPVRAQLQSLHSPDLFDMRHTSPEDPEDFIIGVQAMIGPEGTSDKESFDFDVCTPAALAGKLSAGTGHVFGRHHLIVSSYSFSVIWNAIEALCQRTWGQDWDEVASKLARYGLWEFEDYQPYDGPR